MNIEEAARAWHAAGASVLPAMRGKRPIVSWTAYQEEAADPGEWWPTSSHDGLGIVTGYNGFEMLEIEGTAMDLLGPLGEALASAGYLARLSTYVEVTPSGGFHWIYRVDGEQEGNQKLARSATGKTMIETRGRFGWVVVAPSGPEIHEELDEGWVLVGSSVPGVVATFTEQEIEEIYEICRTFDQLPPPAPEMHRQPLQRPADGSVAPGQDYETRETWESVLEPLGWHKHPRGWTRPGKRYGLSATITPSDNLYVWSSSVSPLEPEQSYTKFRVYSLLNHNGDDSAAARALRGAGYGSPAAERVRLVSVPTGGVPPVRPSPPVAGAAALAEAPAQIDYTLSEEGNVRLVTAAIEGRFLFVPERQKWLMWDGTRWRPESDDGPVAWATREVINGLQTGGDEGLAKHKQRSLHMGSIVRVSRALSQAPSLRTRAEKLDAEPYALNTPSGILNLATGEISPPDPRGLHTRITGCGVDFELPCPQWLQFLGETFVGDVALIEFIQRLAGYSCIGEVTHNVLPFLHGSGANGKSVFLEVMQGVLGDYAGTAPADLLLQTGKEDHYAKAPLAGQRFVVASEVPPTARFHEQRVKELTGGDRITGRFMRADFFTWVPTHHLWLAGNHQPRVSAGGDSFWRRLRLVPFAYTVPESRRDPELARRLVAEEGPAILAWLASGARMQSQQGLGEPDTVKAATAGYAEEEDAVGRFLSERIVQGGDPIVNRVNSKIVYAAYEQWCRNEGVHPAPAHVFGRELKQRGIEKKPSNGQNFYIRVTLLNGEEEPDERPFQMGFD
jgi:putative DNA primase/helicase